MDRGGHHLGRWAGKESATLLKKTVIRPDHRMRSRRAQTNDQARPDNGELCLKPRLASDDLGGRWFLVNPPLAALLELKVFYGVGHVDFRAVDSSIGESAVEKCARGANEGASSQILSVARLFPDQHNLR